MEGNPLSEIESLEKRLSLPTGFFVRLLSTDDDWSFLIKLNALFEAVTTHVLVTRLGGKDIEEELANLDYANAKYGKLKLLHKLSALNKNQFTSLQGLAEYRNRLVHRIQNVTFSLSDDIRSFDGNQTKKFCKTFGYALESKLRVASGTIEKSKFITENPRLTIWLNALDILACLNLEFELTALKQREKEIQAKASWLSDLGSVLLEKN